MAHGPRQWRDGRECFGRSLVRQCHTYLLTYYPTGTTRRVPGYPILNFFYLGTRYPANELPDNGSPSVDRLIAAVCINE